MHGATIKKMCNRSLIACNIVIFFVKPDDDPTGSKHVSILSKNLTFLLQNNCVILIFLSYEKFMKYDGRLSSMLNPAG